MAQTYYNLTSIQVGLMITLPGIAGFIQLLWFKSIWTSRFVDMQLMLFGIAVMAAAQLVIFPYGQKQPHLGQFISCLTLMYGLGYPVGHTAVLGAFSKIQKHGKQGAMMGWFATAGSLARILFPIASGLSNTFAANSPFMIVLLLLILSYVGLILLRNRINFYIEDNRSDQTVLTIWDKQQLGVCGLLFFLSLLLIVLLCNRTSNGTNIFVYFEWEGENER
jgi:ceroid-lipofuscinosis MFS transporter 7